MRCIIPIILLLLLIGTAGATDYYMSPTGDNSSDGLTLSTAWANLSHAQTVLTASDTLWIVDGSYTNDSFRAQVNGTAANPITIQTYNGTPTFWDRTGTVGRTLNLFQFGDDYYSTYGYKHDYVIRGPMVVHNYSTTLEMYGCNENVTISDFTAYNHTYFFHLMQANERIDISNVTCHDLYYAPFHFWRNNSYCTLTNASVTGDVYDHGIIDFHTNNSNIVIRDVSAVCQMDFGEAIYVHGDCENGENRNNSVYNVSIDMHLSAGLSTKEVMDIWQPGFDNYFENITLKHVGGESNLLNMGETCGMSTPYPTNFTLKGSHFIDAGGRAIYLEIGCPIGTVLFDDILITNCTSAIDISVAHGYRIDHLTFRDMWGDDNDWVIYTTSGVSGDHSIEYSEGTVFTITATDEPLYYPNISNYTISDNDTYTVVHYNVTLAPANAYLQNVTVNHDSVSTNDYTNITVNSSVATNPTWVNATMQNASHNYSVAVDDLIVDYIISDSDGVVRYQYTSSWSPHDFEFDWVDVDFTIDHTKMYYNTALPVSNTINSTGYTNYNKTVWKEDVVISSSRLAVST